MDMRTLSAKRQDLFFQHLLGLEFDVKALSAEYKTNFEKKMFCLPNQTAFEVVSYFLFSKLNEVSKKQYQIVWPLLTIEQHKEFRKTCFTHLSTISKESEIIFPRVNSTVLSSYGEPFYELYFAFSTHVIVEVNKSYEMPMLRRTKGNVQYHEKIIEILQINTISSIEKFRELTKVSHHNLESYFSCAKNLVVFIEKVKSSNASKQSLLELKIQKLCSIYFDENNSLQNVSSEQAFEKSVKYVEKIKKYWKRLEDFLSKEEKFWNCLSTEIDENHMKYVLKGEEFKIPLPNIVKETCDAETLEAVLLTEEKELCIFRFLKLFKIVLEFYINSFQKTRFSKLTLTETLKDTSKLEDCLKMLRSLSESLEKDNELSKSSHEELMGKLDMEKSLEKEVVLHKDFPPSPSKCYQSCNISKFTSIFNTPLKTEAAAIDLIDNKFKENFTHVYNNCKDTSRIQQDNISVSPSLEETRLNLYPDEPNAFTQDSCIYSLFAKQSIEPNCGDENESPVIQNLLCEKEFSNESLRQHLELENPIIDISTKFNLRPSLLLEESLNSQTLSENVSFLD